MLRIALAGRTNSGKTTLARTLLRRPVGLAADRANVSKQAAEYSDSELGVTLVDCPGYQGVSTFRAYKILLSRGDHAAAEALKEGVDVSFEENAYDAISSCDIAYYIASLEEVPTQAHGQELDLTAEALATCSGTDDVEASSNSPQEMKNAASQARILGVINKRDLTMLSGTYGGSRAENPCKPIGVFSPGCLSRIRSPTSTPTGPPLRALESAQGWDEI